MTHHRVRSGGSQPPAGAAELGANLTFRGAGRGSSQPRHIQTAMAETAAAAPKVGVESGRPIRMELCRPQPPRARARPFAGASRETAGRR
eukprot:scaffold423341_cov36-Prasinocladus_malaysianus.AAC.1